MSVTKTDQSRRQTLIKGRELEIRANQAHQFRIRCGFTILPVVTGFVLELDNNEEYALKCFEHGIKDIPLACRGNS